MFSCAVRSTFFFGAMFAGVLSEGLSEGMPLSSTREFELCGAVGGNEMPRPTNALTTRLISTSNFEILHCLDCDSCSRTSFADRPYSLALLSSVSYAMAFAAFTIA